MADARLVQGRDQARPERLANSCDAFVLVADPRVKHLHSWQTPPLGVLYSPRRLLWSRYPYGPLGACPAVLGLAKRLHDSSPSPEGGPYDTAAIVKTVTCALVQAP